MENRITEGPTEKRWIASPDVVASPISGDLALLDTATDQYFTLNGSGAHIWTLLDQPRTASDLSDALAQAFDKPHEECRDDTTALLGALADNGLIRDANAQNTQ